METQTKQTVQITLRVNGENFTLEVEPRMLLADALRHKLGLTGTHVGCEQGVCGACSVLIDGEPQRSCLMFAVQAQGAEITTIEGVTPEEGMSPLQASFQKHHGLQCGFCTPSMILTSEALLKKNPNPTEEDIREALSGNLCRCTGYQFIVDAVQDVAGNGSLNANGSLSAADASANAATAGSAKEGE